MCLAIPGQVLSIEDRDGMRMGMVDFSGIRKEVCLAYLPEVQVGDYTIVHVGFALTRIDEASAQESLRAFAQMGVLEEELEQLRESDAEGTAGPGQGGGAQP
ncbi:MAG: HypC/HybG/HupF family hydrogenase formation chaperone [Bryobacterales bacterium]|jgi:hydrogenase expression/formation protein HypC|nr:HypC/HybG/HupF family hydrogenase formation chaperone [Bryobacterales bacterium]